MRSVTESSPWVLVPVPQASARLRLLCFPYAGGGPSAFMSWAPQLSPHVEVCAVQMPGRESRLGEPPITRWPEAIDRLTVGLSPWLDRPFALFGHSLGADLAFEFARRLRRDGKPGPVRLIVSARGAPHLAHDDPPTHHLPRREFLEALRQFDGTPEEVLRNEELLELFLPLLRADLYLSETYLYREEAPLSVPITAFGGLRDRRAAVARVEQWRAHTSAEFRSVAFSGGHFFLRDNRAAVLLEVARDLGVPAACGDDAVGTAAG